MNTQRVSIAALVLLAALCAAACGGESGTTNQNGDTYAGESQTVGTNANRKGVATPTPAGAAAQRPAASESKTKPFLALITDGKCEGCADLEAQMKALSEELKLPLYVLKPTGDERLAQDIDLDNYEARAKTLPWAAVFSAGGNHPAGQVGGLSPGQTAALVVEQMKNAAKIKLAAQPPNPDEASGGGPAATAETKEYIDRRLAGLKDELSKDPDFRSSLLTDKKFKEDLAADEGFRKELLTNKTFKETLASDPDFRAALSGSGPGSIIASTVLGLFALSGLGLGGWVYWKMRNAERQSRSRAESAALLKAEREKEAGIQQEEAKRQQEVAAQHDSRKAMLLRAVRRGAVRHTVESYRQVAKTLKEHTELLEGLTKSGEEEHTQQSEQQSQQPEDIKTEERGHQPEDIEALVDLKVEEKLNKVEERLNLELAKVKGDLQGGLYTRLSQFTLPRAEVVSRADFDAEIVEIKKQVGIFDTELSEDEKEGALTFLQTESAEAPNAAGVTAGLVANEEGEAAKSPLTETAGEGLTPAPPHVEELEALTRRVVEETLNKPDGIRQQLAGLTGQGDLAQRVSQLEEAGRTTPDLTGLVEGQVKALWAGLQRDDAPARQALEDRVGRAEALKAELTQLVTETAAEQSRVLGERIEEQGAATRTLVESLSAQVGTFNVTLLSKLDKQKLEADGRHQALDSSIEELKGQWQGSQSALEAVQASGQATAQALAETAGLLVNSRAASFAARLHGDDEERARAAQSLEWYQKQLGEIAAVVAPLAGSVSELVAAAASARKLPPEINSRLPELQDGVARYARLGRQAAERIEALRCDSVRTRYEGFREELERLNQRLDAKELSHDEFAGAALALSEKYFADGAHAEQGGASASAVAEESKERVSRMEDDLMDWFSSFSQLHARLEEVRASGEPVDEEVVRAMGRVLEDAREVLSRFDIQPEEIQIGQTMYDRRLHDFVLTRQSSYPTHTIIEVRRSGFRRMRDGETLRRPQVVVAGTGVVSGTI